jgi:hypothetical protein
VSDYVCQEFNRADSLENNGRKGTIGFALTTLQRRLASSPEAIYQSLKRRKARLEHRLHEEQQVRRGGDVPMEGDAWRGDTGRGDTGRGQASPLHFGVWGDAPIELLQGLPLLTDDDLDDLDDAPDAELEATPFTHALRDQNSPARQETAKIMDFRANTRRNYRNTLVFLAPDRTRMEELKKAVRQFLAWKSIDEESESLNLDAFQRNQARTKRKETNDRCTALIPETYIWLVVPDQPDPKGAEILEDIKMQPQPQSPLAVNASRRLKSEGMLLTEL